MVSPYVTIQVEGCLVDELSAEESGCPSWQTDMLQPFILKTKLTTKPDFMRASIYL